MIYKNNLQIVNFFMYMNKEAIMVVIAW